MASSWFFDVEFDDDKRKKSAGRRKKKLVSFLGCLKQKYCGHEDVTTSSLVTIVFHGRPKSTGKGELDYLRNVVLSDCGISVAGLDGCSLKSLCPNVVDLDLSDNLLTTWAEIIPIISQLDSLRFLNLAGNKLKNLEECLQQGSGTLPGIENLVLNRTAIPWTDVLTLTSGLADLKELHLCGNGYTDLPDSVLLGLDSVECLRLNGNQISSWKEIWKLRSLSCLKSLILSGNPLIDVFFHKNDFATDAPNSENICIHCYGQGNDLEKVNNDKSETELNATADNTNNVSEEKGNNKHGDGKTNHRFEHYEQSSEYDEVGRNTKDLENLNDEQEDRDVNDDEAEDITKGIEEWCNKVLSDIISELEKEYKEQAVPETSNDSSDTRDKLLSTGTLKERNSEGENCSICMCKRICKSPFVALETLCLSETNLGKWKHLSAVAEFPALKSLRIKDIKLCSKLSQDDRRKLFVASLPNIQLLNGSEVSVTEREKAERHLVRHFCDRPKKPDIFHRLEKKHGKLEPLVDIDISRGYQEWITLTFIFQGAVVCTETVRVREPVGRLRLIIAEKLSLYASLKNIQMYHKLCNPSHQEKNYGEVPQQFNQLFLDSLPMSRFDLMDGDEIHIDVTDGFSTGALNYIYLRNFMPKNMFHD